MVKVLRTGPQAPAAPEPSSTTSAVTNPVAKSLALSEPSFALSVARGLSPLGDAFNLF